MESNKFVLRYRKNVEVTVEASVVKSYLYTPVAPVVPLVTSKPSDVGT